MDWYDVDNESDDERAAAPGQLFGRGGRGGRGRRLRGRGGFNGQNHRGHMGAFRQEPIDGCIRHARVQMEDDSMLLSYSKRFGGDPGSVQYLDNEISADFKYFEIEIVDWGVEGRIGLGLAHRNYPLGNMPGWRSGSVGYHADDGRLFKENGHGQQFGPKCAVGDRMGCGVEFDEVDEEEGLVVYFTRNGERVGKDVRLTVPEGGFFPMVAMHSEGEQIRVDLDVGSANPGAREVVMRVIESTVADGGGAPEEAAAWNRLSHVRQDGSKLVYTTSGKSGLAQCEQPVTLRWPYFELEIVDAGANGYIAIGVAHSKYPFGQHPGWKKNSVAYHADDGKLFNGCGQGEAFGPPCRQGDRMGCGIYFRPRDWGIPGNWDPPSSSDESDDDDDDDDNSCSSSSEEESTDDRRVYVYFTHNGKKIGGCPSVVPPGGYFPTIGLMSRGEVVKTFVRALSG